MAKSALKRDAEEKRKAITTRARAKAKSEASRVRSNQRAYTDEHRPTKREAEDLKRRNQLIDQYMPYAASIASRVCQSLSSAVDYDEVLCNARLGLLEAAKRFDENQEVDFRTFAYYRIKGAIYDGLRRSGWLPRTLYAKIKFEEAANEFLQNRSLYNNDAAEKTDRIYDTNFSDSDTVTNTVNSLASIYIVSIDASDDIDIEDENGNNIEQRTEFMQIRKHMRDAIGTLPEKEKQLVMMYYFQNRTLEEIGVRLGLSKSWTSRLHARALSLLFKRIRHRAQQKEQDEGEKE